MIALFVIGTGGCGQIGSTTRVIIITGANRRRRRSAAVTGGGGGGGGGVVGGRHGVRVRRQPGIVRASTATDLLSTVHQGVADEDRAANPRRTAGQGARQAAAGAGRPGGGCGRTARRPAAEPAAGSRENAADSNGRVPAGVVRQTDRRT